MQWPVGDIGLHSICKPVSSGTIEIPKCHMCVAVRSEKFPRFFAVNLYKGLAFPGVVVEDPAAYGLFGRQPGVGG